MAGVRGSWLLITCCCLLSIVNGQFDWPSIKNDHKLLAESVEILTRNYLSKASSTVVVLERSWNVKMHHKHSHILEHILMNLHGAMAVQLYAGQSNNRPWEYYIFVVDGIDSFMNVGWNFTQTYFDRDFHFLIILTQFTTDFMKTLKEIFISCRRLDVLNANIILDHPVLGVCMYKYSWFSRDKCSEVQPYLYFCFKDGIHQLREVFPQKLVNYWGCPLRITARFVSPFVKLIGKRGNIVPETAWQDLGGIEVDLLKVVAKALNFTIHLVSIQNKIKFNQNATHNFCFTELLDEKADIAVGGFGASDPIRRFLSATIVFHYSPNVFIVRQGMPKGSVNRLSRPFKGEVWILLAFCLFIGSLTLYLLRLANPEVQNFVVGFRNHTPVTNFIAVFLGYPMTQLPMRNFARYLLTVWLLMSLVIRNAYQGGLYDCFRMDRNMRIPTNYDELIEHDYKILVSKPSDCFDIFPINRSIITGLGQAERMKILEVNEGRFTVIVARENFINYLEENYRNGSKLVMVRKPALMYPSAFFSHKNSIYLSSINNKLGLLTNAGIVKLIYSNNVMNYRLFYRRKRNVSPEAIKFFRLKGIYCICGLMLFLGFVVFVLELLSYHFEHLRFLLNRIS